MHEQTVLAPHFVAELAQGFEERLGLDIADRPADFEMTISAPVSFETSPIRRLISLVMCGMTWIVPPR